MTSNTLQFWWATGATIAVSVLIGFGITMTIINHINKRRMWREIGKEVNPAETISESITTTAGHAEFDPYPHRPIDPERYRISDDERERNEQMVRLADGDPGRLMRLRRSMDMHEIKHIDGIPWHKAPVPPKRHRCWPQSEGWIMLRQVQRCACGAIRESDYPQWTRRNERKQA